MLDQYPGVGETVVIIREDVAGDKRLVAYLVWHDLCTATMNDLSGFLKQQLPEYMVPSAFVFLDTLPLTPNGKVDRHALPAPDLLREEPEAAFVAPRNELEFLLTKIWEKVLGIRPISVRDNFFDLGGNSLLGVRLFAEIEQTFGKHLPLATLFHTPEVEQLANILRQKEWSVPWSSLVPLKPEGSKPPFFCVDSVNAFIFIYLCMHLSPEQPFYGLQPPSQYRVENPHVQIKTLASQYVAEVRALQPEGPYFLGGLCSGGLIAFEMAQQLQAQGQKVALLVLLDTPRSVPSLVPYPIERYIRGFVSDVKRCVHHLRNL